MGINRLKRRGVRVPLDFYRRFSDGVKCTMPRFTGALWYMCLTRCRERYLRRPYCIGQSHPKIPALKSAYKSPSNVFLKVVDHARLYQIDCCHPAMT